MKKFAFLAVFFLLAASVASAWAAEAEVPENADAAVVSEPEAEPVENAEAQEPVKKSFWEKAGDLKKAAVEKAGEVKETIAEKAGEVKEAVTEKTGVVKETVSEKAGVVKETVSEKAGVVKETVTEKVGAVKETVTEKAGEMKEAAVQKVGEVKDAVVQKAGELKEKVVEKTKQIGGKYQSGKDWLEKKKEEYRSFKSWKQAKKEHWNDFRERKYLERPHPAMVVYSWIFVSVSGISFLLLGVSFLMDLIRGWDTFPFKVLFKHFFFFLFICFTLSISAFYYVCTCESDFSFFVCFLGVFVFWILFAVWAEGEEMGFLREEPLKGPCGCIVLGILDSFFLGRFLMGCPFGIIFGGVFLFLAFFLSILIMHIVWFMYVLGCFCYFYLNCFGRFPQVGRDEIALQEGIEEKP